MEDLNVIHAEKNSIFFVKFYFITINVAWKIHKLLFSIFKNVYFVFLIGLICVDTGTTLDKRGMLWQIWPLVILWWLLI